MKLLLLFSLFPLCVTAIDKISCLQAKSKFLACAELSKTEDIPLRSCLTADSGYSDCRKIEGEGSHNRCLSTKGQYAFCRELNGGSLTHNQCALADSGFKDCVQWTKNPLLCLGAKGGYDACRRGNPEHPHTICLSADSGYSDCLALGGNHNECIAARRSYKYCRETDHHSEQFCLRVGKGYMECRKAGFALAFCNQADHGFSDCVNY